MGVAGEHGARDVACDAHDHLVAGAGLGEFGDQRVAVVMPAAFHPAACAVSAASAVSFSGITRPVPASLFALGAQMFTSQKEFTKLASGWPLARLVETWNSRNQPDLGRHSITSARRHRRRQGCAEARGQGLLSAASVTRNRRRNASRATAALVQGVHIFAAGLVVRKRSMHETAVSFPSVQETLRRALSERGYSEPTPVQNAVLHPDSAERDLLVSAQTGSGKTVAYGLAIGCTILGDAGRFEPPRQPVALVVAPTRELALQVQRELDWLFAHANARVISCVGGMDIRREQRALAQGAHVVVGTPGRLCDHLDRNRLKLSSLRVVVLDEADEMLDLGFRENLEKLQIGRASCRERV